MRNARSVFLSGLLAYSPAHGAFSERNDLGQSHYALPACAEASAGRRACDIIRDSAGSKSELFGIMTTNKSVKFVDTDKLAVSFAQGL